MSYIKKNILIILILILSSCLDADIHIDIKEDGSGESNVKYTLDNALLSLVDIDLNTKDFGIPITKEQVRSINTDSLKNTGFSKKETEDELKAEYGFTFKNIVDMQDINKDVYKVSYAKKDGKAKLNFVLFPGTNSNFVKASETNITEDQKDIIEPILSGHKINYIFNLPRQILSNNIGNLSKDKKTLTYSLSLDKLISVKDPIILKITY